MLDLHNILNKLIKWVNSIGQPKTIQNIKDVEVISAIKVKKNKEKRIRLRKKLESKS